MLLCDNGVTMWFPNDARTKEILRFKIKNQTIDYQGGILIAQGNFEQFQIKF